MRWIKNTSGKEDAMLTLAVIGFVIVVAKLLLAGNSIMISGDVYNFGALSAAEIAAILTPTLGAYVTRRHTDCKWDSAEYSDDEEDAE